jgi:hypothetical protein
MPESRLRSQREGATGQDRALSNVRPAGRMEMAEHSFNARSLAGVLEASR